MVDTVFNNPNYHAQTKELYSQLHTECQKQYDHAQKKLAKHRKKNGEMHNILKYEVDKRKMK